MQPQGVGELSSKYAYDRTGAQFEADLQAREARYNYLWAEFVAFMAAHDVTPTELCGMFTRYYDEFVK